MAISLHALDESRNSEIAGHCAEGDRLAAQGKFRDAMTAYNEAWKLVPSPKEQWEASTWILAAIADAAFLGGFKTSALQALEFAMHCPGAIGNPFLHLRLGQVRFDRDELDSAADELMRAYMGGGAEIFAQEDPKYLAFLGARAKL